uniref:DUF5641 domain-containing protein n=1 Tax=Anopheles epiroticus TaxID=199890 RepID=A0A182PWZ9_9DIPT
TGKEVPRNSKLKWLSPIIDDLRVLRVGGRLRNTHMANSAKHPILLSSKHPLAALLAVAYHQKHLHTGPGHLLSILRERFWIIGGQYLQQLQARAKRLDQPVSLQIGQLAIIKEDNVPPTMWPMGRITRLHPGKDGVVRVVTLRTTAGKEIVRATARVAILPNPNVS